MLLSSTIRHEAEKVVELREQLFKVTLDRDNYKYFLEESERQRMYSDKQLTIAKKEPES